MCTLSELDVRCDGVQTACWDFRRLELCQTSSTEAFNVYSVVFFPLKTDNHLLHLHCLGDLATLFFP